VLQSSDFAKYAYACPIRHKVYNNCEIMHSPISLSSALCEETICPMWHFLKIYETMKENINEK